MKVLCILTNGFEDVEALGTIGLLRRSELQVDIATLKGYEATGKYDTHLTNLANIYEINYKNYDLLFIPGGPHYAALEENDLVIEIIKYYAKHHYLAGICAAPTIFGHLGLLKNLSYTCFTSMNEDFGGNFTNEYATLDKNIITGKSAAATIDFALKIIEVLQGFSKRKQIEDMIYYKK